MEKRVVEKTNSSSEPRGLARIARDQENGAKRAVLEELFNDIYKDRKRIYWANFVRGLFFGFGSVLGGTLLIAILVWILAQLGAIVPFLSDFIQQLLDALSVSRR